MENDDIAYFKWYDEDIHKTCTLKGYRYKYEINYCPFCGTKLEKEK